MIRIHSESEIQGSEKLRNLSVVVLRSASSAVDEKHCWRLKRAGNNQPGLSSKCAADCRWEETVVGSNRKGTSPHDRLRGL